MNSNRENVIIRHAVVMPAIAGMPLGNSNIATKVPQLIMP